jgi:hypothetical protein
VTLGLAILVMGMMAQRAFPAGEPAKLRVLIFSGLNNHDWRSTTPVIKGVFTDCARFGRVDVTEDPAGLNTATLSRYDVLVSSQVTLPPPAIWPSTPAAMTAAGIDLTASRATGTAMSGSRCTRFRNWFYMPTAWPATTPRGFVVIWRTGWRRC